MEEDGGRDWKDVSSFVWPIKSESDQVLERELIKDFESSSGFRINFRSFNLFLNPKDGF